MKLHKPTCVVIFLNSVKTQPTRTLLCCETKRSKQWVTKVDMQSLSNPKLFRHSHRGCRNQSGQMYENTTILRHTSWCPANKVRLYGLQCSWQNLLVHLSKPCLQLIQSLTSFSKLTILYCLSLLNLEELNPKTATAKLSVFSFPIRCSRWLLSNVRWPVLLEWNPRHVIWVHSPHRGSSIFWKVWKMPNLFPGKNTERLISSIKGACSRQSTKIRRTKRWLHNFTRRFSVNL